MVKVSHHGITLNLHKSSNLLTANGDKLNSKKKKLVEPFLSRKLVIIQSIARGFLSRKAVIEKKQKIITMVIKCQDLYLQNHHQSLYARRRLRGSILGDKLHCEKMLNLIANGDKTGDYMKKREYYLKRLEVIDNAVLKMPLSPEMVTLQKEEKQIEEIRSYHHKQIEILQNQIKVHHLQYNSYGDRLEIIKNKKVTIYDEQFKKIKQESITAYEKQYGDWCKSAGEEPLTANGDKNPLLWKMFSMTFPYKEPKNPHDKPVRKKKTTTQKCIPCGDGDKKSSPKLKKATGSITCYGECPARLNKQTSDGQLGGFRACGKSITVNGDTHCKTHMKSNPRGDYGDGKLPEKIKNNKKKINGVVWLKYLTEVSPEAEENKKDLGLA